MKVENKIYCHDHGEEIIVVDIDVDPIANDKVTQKTLTTYIKPCSQCMAESYERGRGWRNDES